MAIVQKRGGALVFVDEQGNQFNTSVNFMLGLINGKSPAGFIQLTRWANRMDMSRFKPSLIVDGHGNVLKGVDPKTFEPSEIDYTRDGKKKYQQKKALEGDDNVW